MGLWWPLWPLPLSKESLPDPQESHLLLHIPFVLQERIPVQEARAECPGVSASVTATWPPSLEHGSGRK